MGSATTGQQLKEEINTNAQQIIDWVQRSQTFLLLQIDTIVQHKTQVLTAQRQQAQKIRAKLKTCQDMVEHYLKEWTQYQILAAKHMMMDEMSKTTQDVDPIIFRPIENANIKFLTINQILEGDIGVVSSSMVGKATLEVSPCLAKQLSTATLTIPSHNANTPFSLPPSLVSSTLASPDDKHIIRCGITQTHPGKYNISFTPSTRGAHILTVQVGGVDIPDSPFTIPVLPLPEMRGEPVNVITGLNRPVDVAVCDNGDIVIAENGAHCITILNRNGRKVRSFGTRGTREGEFECPRGVAISNDGHVLVVDSHRLQKLTTDGVCVKSVGSSNEGSGPLEFNRPSNIAIYPATGQIFIADIFNNRIQVFNNDLTFSHSITHKPLKWPCDIALDSEGYVYIANSGYHCIIKVTTSGQYIKKVADVRTRPAVFINFSLTIHNGVVYVSEYGCDRISMFDNSTGKPVICSINKNIFNCPSGLAADTLGNLYICDTKNDRIVVF